MGANLGVSSTAIGIFLARFVVFHSKVMHFPVDAYDWRGPCKPIAPTRTVIAECKSTERDECLVALFCGCVSLAPPQRFARFERVVRRFVWRVRLRSLGMHPAFRP